MGPKKWAPWKENSIKFETSKTENIERQHNQEIKEILLNKGIIGYPVGTKLGNQKTGIGLHLVNGVKGNTETKAIKYSWYLGLNQEIIDAELLAISKVLSEALRIINQTPNNSDKRTKIYIYTESHTAIQRLQKIQDLGPGRDIVQKCAILAQSLQNKGIETTIRRVPKGSKIQGTIIADNLAKKGAKSISNLENPISLYQIRRRLNQSIKEKWICYWNRNKKGRYYL
jgi:hypothetical protein